MVAGSLIVKFSSRGLLRLPGIPFPMRGFQPTLQRLKVLEKRGKGHHCLREDRVLDTCQAFETVFHTILIYSFKYQGMWQDEACILSPKEGPWLPREIPSK